MLKILLIRSKIDAKKAELAKNEANGKELETRANDMQTRKAELEAAISELTAENTQEERDAVEAQVTAYEADKTSLEEETTEHNNAREGILREIEELENELNELESKQAEPAKQPEERSKDMPETEDDNITHRNIERKYTAMNKRFKDLNTTEKNTIVEKDSIKAFAERCREAMIQKRSIGNVGLVIPDELVDFIHYEAEASSKLLKYFRVRRIKGNGRAIVSAGPLEAYWTELCANLKELDLSFGRVPVTPHKVGAYVAVCNAVLEMSDIDLVEEVIRSLGEAIAVAYDKAFLFGDGNTMPLGIATRLIQTAQPANYPADGRTWEDLSANGDAHVFQFDSTQLAALIAALGKTSSQYGSTNKFWAMSEVTKASLIANYFLGRNSDGVYVSGLNNDEFPIVGGKIEIVNTMPAGLVVGGYGSGYVVAETRDWKFAESEHAHFIEDETLFKVTGYADGQPAIPEAFVAFTIDEASGSELPADVINSVTFAS